jgi:hypothetical protein
VFLFTIGAVGRNLNDVDIGPYMKTRPHAMHVDGQWGSQPPVWPVVRWAAGLVMGNPRNRLLHNITGLLLFPSVVTNNVRF